MRAYIIDDEDAPRLILKHLLGQISTNVEVIGESNNLKDGVEEIKQKGIDVLFLDIEMPRHRGLEIDQFFDGVIDFEIVFVTAYSEFAIRAFKLSAFDYLLKPLKKVDLEDTLKRLEKKKSQISNQENHLKLLSQNLESQDNQHYLLRTHREDVIIKINEIVSLEADGMYTDIVLKDERITASKPMKEILADLPDFFFRTHRSYSINLNQVAIPVRITQEGVKTKNGTFVPLSSRSKQLFLDRIDQFALA